MKEYYRDMRPLGHGMLKLITVSVTEGVTGTHFLRENAEKMAAFLEKHPVVNWVNYAALPTSDHYDTCQRICGGKAAGIISFGIEGGITAGSKFIDALKLILRLVNIGDAKSLACHPASTTHRQLNAQELASAGVSEDMVRISVGIEHIDDIVADIEQALAASQR